MFCFFEKRLEKANKCSYNENNKSRTNIRTVIEMGQSVPAVTLEKSIEEKLKILSDAAKYDVACTSSGSDRRGQKGMLGNSVAAGVCHAFAADGRCISLLKILMSNHCVYDCKYCINRKSNDIARATFTPQEICELTVEFYRRNYIEGLFLSSGVLNNPNETMEKMCQTLRLLRTVYHFNGYIHVKAIPGASAELLYSAGLLADRISLNMELPTQASLGKLCPNKHMNQIIRPMNCISETIAVNRITHGKTARLDRAGINRHLENSIFGETSRRIEANAAQSLQTMRFQYPAERMDALLHRDFAPAGQSTQMIIGATEETDFELIRTSQQLYQSFDLKRVFYSGYIPINDDTALPEIGTLVPLLREHRLYQADWLMRFYGFHANELLSEEQPFFDRHIDPKCEWALRHLGEFPVEINRASYDQLLRVPGIGPTGVKKIMSARRYGSVNFDMLKKMHIALKRAQYFITCNGKMLYPIPISQNFIRNQLTDLDRVEIAKIEGNTVTYQQMNLFRDFHMEGQA